MLFECREVLGLGTIGQDSRVDLRVQRLHATAEHLGKAGHVRHVLVGDARVAQGTRRAARSDELHAQALEPLGEIDQPSLVPHTEQRSH